MLRLETFLLSLQIHTPPFNTLLPAPRNVMFNTLFSGLEGCHLWRAPLGWDRVKERSEEREFITPAPSLQGHQGLSLYPQ